MSLKKIIPWNWFKKEDEKSREVVPVKKQAENQVPPVALRAEDVWDSPVEQLWEGLLARMNMLAPSFAGSSMVLKPTLDLHVNDKEYIISVEIPGVNEDDIKIEITDDYLIIRGEKKQEEELKDGHSYRVERSYGMFQRILNLPEDADKDKVEASFKKGVLVITIPRKEGAADEIREVKIKK